MCVCVCVYVCVCVCVCVCLYVCVCVCMCLSSMMSIIISNSYYSKEAGCSLSVLVKSSESINTSIKEADTVSTFKIRLKTFLFSQIYGC